MMRASAMSRSFSLFVLVLASLSLGCATAYKPTGLTGGFEETKLGENLYQVRFQGNGYTTHGRVAQLLLRRCAELTLENGFRYFAIASDNRQTSVGGAEGFMFSFPNGQAIIRLLASKDQDEVPIDAVTVVGETDRAAQGRLSEKARQAMSGFQAGESAPH
jgi:hypothetical protein